MDNTCNDPNSPTNFSNPLYDGGVSAKPETDKPPVSTTATPSEQLKQRPPGGFKPTTADSDKDTIALVEAEEDD